MIAIMRYLKPYWMMIGLILLLTLSASLLELYLPTLMAEVVDQGIVKRDIPLIMEKGGWMIVCSILAVGLTIAMAYIASKVSLRFGKDLRSHLFRHVEGFSFKEMELFGAASLITRTTHDIKQIQDVTNMILRMMTQAPLMLIGGIILAISQDAHLSWIFLAVLPLLAGMILFIIWKAIPLFTSLQQKTDQINRVMRETLMGSRVIRSFNQVEREKKRFHRANLDFQALGIRVNRLMSLFLPIIILVFCFTELAIIWFGAIRIDQGDMQVGSLMAFLQYAMMILMSLIMLSFAFFSLPGAQASARRIQEVLDVQPSIDDPDQPMKPKSEIGSIEFRNVTFRYGDSERPALQQISFTVKPGKTTAIIGSTGAGKTTLLNLIPRFFDVEEGEIWVNGVDVRRIPIDLLRKQFGMVPQRASLFSGSIADNVRVGKQEASDEEVRAALEIAQAGDFIQEKGIEAKIEQAGANLSGGQKQRISIARAIVRWPSIYLLDDCFSALDYQTDARLRRELKSLIQQKQATVLLVAQRVSTVMDADQIIVLHEGKIAGMGSHQQLIKDNAIYQDIVSSQVTDTA